MTLEAIVAQVESYGAHYVTVSGGEPLAQPNCLPLLQQLCDKGYEVSLETSGALDIAAVDSRVVTVMDLKTPSSQECDRNLEANIAHLKPHDQVKFVIGDQKDYEWSKAKCDQYDLRSRVSEVLFSPVFESLSYKDLAQWILNDKLRVRMQVQLHKHIWGDKPGH